MSERIKKPSSLPRTGTKSVPTVDHAHDRMPNRRDPSASTSKGEVREGFTVQSLMPPPKTPPKK